MNQSIAFAVITILFCVWVCSAIPKPHLDEIQNSEEGKEILNNQSLLNIKCMHEVFFPVDLEVLTMLRYCPLCTNYIIMSECLRINDAIMHALKTLGALQISPKLL
jgi:hypothetical protein